MKIEKQKSYALFGNLLPGDVFENSVGLCMKINPIEISGNMEINCINLEDGTSYYLDQFEEVNWINCTLMLK